MRKNLPSQSGISIPRVLLAFILCSIGASLAVFSFAQGPLSGRDAAPYSSVVTIPGFHAPVTMPGSGGGSEPSLAITNNGIRYVSWQAPGMFAKSADGVNFNQITTPDSGAHLHLPEH